MVYLLKTIMLISLWLGSSTLLAQVGDRPKEDRGFWDFLFEGFIDRQVEVPTSIGNVHEEIYRLIDLEGDWKFEIGNDENWSSPAYNDNSWVNIRVPSGWEEDGFNGYDGFAWYRIHFDGRQLRPHEAHYLILGFIDDVDETFLNGKLVGKSGKFPPRFRTAYDSNREYFLSNDLINFDGDNVIAVKVYDAYRQGGITNGKPGIYVSEESEKLLQNLYGPWRFTKSHGKSYQDPDYDDSSWEVLLVPSFWDNQGYKSFDGRAWYRKKFKLRFELDPAEKYYLVMGKIDDFDVTYLNGRPIGDTNDYEPYGSSRSYQVIRVYEIPRGLLNESGENLIAVKVDDIGSDGGIYAGPIGIVSQKEVTRLIRGRN